MRNILFWWNWRQSWSVWITGMVCGALLMHSLYQTVSVLRSPGLPGEVSSPVTAKTDQRAQAFSVQSILDAGFFGSETSGAEDATSLQLRGTFAGSGGASSYAIIASSNGEEKSYRAGDTLADGSEITAIFSDRVMLRKADTRAILTLKEKK